MSDRSFGGSNTGGDNTGNDNTGSDNNHHEYVDDNGICSVCGKSKDEHSKGIVIGKDDDEGVPVLPEAPSISSYCFLYQQEVQDLE